jgi:hypothetical protein
LLLKRAFTAEALAAAATREKRIKLRERSGTDVQAKKANEPPLASPPSRGRDETMLRANRRK